LEDMEFKPSDMYHMCLKKPELTIHHRKGLGFVLEDKDKKQKLIFRNFKKLTEYFSQYEQKWEHQPYKS